MRFGTRFAAVAALGAIGVLAPAGAAHAAITTFGVSPASGPPGTVVTVSGTGCAPGLLDSPNTDFVAVSAPTLQVTMRVPVAANGSWHGTFTVPATAPTGPASPPAPVVALCISSSFLSLSTIYTPQTFVATAASSPITLPPVTLPGLPTLPVSAPTIASVPTTVPPTTPRSPGSPGSPPPVTDPGFTVVVPGDAPSVVVPGAPVGGATAKTLAAHESGRAHTITALARKGKAAKPATLEPANFGAALAAGGSGTGSLGWLGWLLLVALPVAAAGAAVWQRRLRRSAAEPEPVGDLE